MSFQSAPHYQSAAPTDDMSPTSFSGNQRRRLPQDSISLRRGMVEGHQPPQLIRGGDNTSSYGDGQKPGIRFSNGSSDNSMDGAGNQYGCQRSVNIGGQIYSFDSSGGSGDSSGGEQKGRFLHPHSSAGSGGTRKSNAQDWFNTLNRDIGGYQNYDDDTPYYVQNQRRSKHPLYLRRRLTSKQPSTVQGGHTGNILLDSTEESNSDSFRSVIDDLTIKNQKLKRRLRKFEALHGGNQEDKLFEVKVHGLNEEKRLQFEQLLQSFARGLEEDGNFNHVHMSMSAPQNDSATSLAPDSGYASGSRGDFSSTSGISSRPTARTYQWARGDPETFKMKEVVKKLEQLFTGGEGGTPMQQLQSNISQEHIISYGEEGTREASMMSPTSSWQVVGGEEVVTSKSEPSAVLPNAILEQRPTRPKDLDPRRKQVAEDNIEYLTHLTESSEKGKQCVAGQPGDGWMYLNLMINLAQLHTINVTPPFVKKAISTVSSQLELSSDGKMVRWNGGSEGTKPNGSEGSREDSSEGSPENGSERNKSTEKKLFDTSVNSSGELPTGLGSGSGTDSGQQVTYEPQSTEDKFHYKPLFARSPSFDDDSSSILSSDSAGEGMALRESSDEDLRDSNGHSRGRASMGPLIFYKGGKYCTDLSGWKAKRGPEDIYPYPYDRCTHIPLGSKRKRAASETRFDSPLYNEAISTEEGESDSMDVDEKEQISFSPTFEDALPDTPPPKELEASGIGNVVLDDNFAINVQTRHYILPDSLLKRPIRRPKSIQSKLLKRLRPRVPKSSIEVFYEKDDDETSDSSSVASSRNSSRAASPSRCCYSHKKPLRHELLSAKVIKLPPSALPPATYLPTPTEFSVSESDTDELIPRSSSSEGYFQHMPMKMNAYASPLADDRPASPSIITDSAPSTTMATVGDGADKDWDLPFHLEEEDTTDSGDLGSNESPPDEGLALPHHNLKRSRGSATSVEGLIGSSIGMRKSQRMNDSK